MSKLLYSASMSLDGFIAGPGGDMSWLAVHLGQPDLAAGVLDEILVFIMPVLLGDGVRLYDRPGGRNVKLEPLRGSYTPGTTRLWLRVVR